MNKLETALLGRAILDYRMALAFRLGGPEVLAARAGLTVDAWFSEIEYGATMTAGHRDYWSWSGQPIPGAPDRF